MTWEDAGQLCFDQVPIIAKNLPISYWQSSSDWQQRVRLLFADEERFKSQIDAFMHEFASHRKVPQLSAGILNFLTCIRFMCASDTVNIMLAADNVHRIVPDPAGVADEAILRWLLIETWNEWRWDSFLKLHALLSLGGNNTFYNAPQLPPYAN